MHMTTTVPHKGITMKACTIIKRYLVELDTDGETTDCTVDFNDNGMHYRASLAALQDTGCLENRAGQSRTVPVSIIDTIADWAISRGY